MAKERKWVRPAIMTALGFGAGAVFGGGRMVKIYDWDTEWQIDAPLSEVYAVMTKPEEQYKWWPSMAVMKVVPIPGIPDGRTITYHVKQAASVARLAPPFVIVARTEEIEKERRTRTVVTGDLRGVLETLFYSRPDGGTRIQYHWYVRVSNPILNAFGFVLTPMFRASHDHVMDEGEAGLQQYCREHAKTPVQV